MRSSLFAIVFIFISCNANVETSLTIKNLNDGAGSDSSSAESGGSGSGSGDSGSGSGGSGSGSGDSGAGGSGPAMSEINLDYSDTVQVEEHFTSHNSWFYKANTTQYRPYDDTGGVGAIRCLHRTQGHGSCGEVSKSTFNLPISIELDVTAYYPASSGKGHHIEILLYTGGEPTRYSNDSGNTYFGKPIPSTTNLSWVSWKYHPISG